MKLLAWKRRAPHFAGEEIVCVGDYDSDTMLLTNNELLVERAQKYYGVFEIPTCFVDAKKTPRFYTCAQKADLDIKTSVNKIGEIVNLSQQLNSLMWHKVNSGASVESVMPLYYDICKLAVLSGMEIDRAKKEFLIDSTYEIGVLKEKHKVVEGGQIVKPRFFKMITLENGYALSDKTHYKLFKTSMDYLQKALSSYNFRKNREQKRKIMPLMSIVKDLSSDSRPGYYYSQKDRIVTAVRAAKEDIRVLYVDYDRKSRNEKEIVWRLAAERKQQCVNEIDKMTNAEMTMYITLKEIDTPENKDVARFLFEVLFGKPNLAFFKMIERSKEPLYELTEDENGRIQLYDLRFSKVCVG